MKRFRVSEWTLEIDVIKTGEYYKKRPTYAESCGCTYCRNYVLVCTTLPEAVLAFFNSLGIDLTKEVGEIYENCKNEDGTHFYSGWYHIVGRIVEGQDCMNPPTNWREMNLIEIDGFKFGFTNQLQLVSDDFPSPIIQLEFECNIPWLLNENPEP